MCPLAILSKVRREDFVEDASIVVCHGANLRSGATLRGLMRHVRHVGGGTRVQEGLGRGGGVRHVAIVSTVL